MTVFEETLGKLCTEEVLKEIGDKDITESEFQLLVKEKIKEIARKLFFI